MHKYQPRVHVIRKDFSSDLSPTKPVPVGDGVKTFNFPETVFTTVTAYQNQQVRGHCGQPAASQISKNLCLVIGEECLVLLNDTEKSEWETPVLQHTWNVGDDSVVMPSDSWPGLHLAQTQAPSLRAPHSYVAFVSSCVWGLFHILTVLTVQDWVLLSPGSEDFYVHLSSMWPQSHKASKLQDSLLPFQTLCTFMWSASRPGTCSILFLAYIYSFIKWILRSY